jgi:pyridoxal phosphate enzyme (YggS family)
MGGMDAQAILKQRFADVEERLTAACRRAGRQRSEITLVAVTKTVDVDVAALLPTLGVRNLGESRPQELWRKAEQVRADWHLIGHLQRNKIERTLPLVSRIHSVDSLRLLEALEQEAARQQRTIPVFIEVNAGGEANKLGFAPADVAQVMSRLPSLQHVRVEGLMTMAALVDDPEQARPTFAALRQLRDRWRKEISPPNTLEHLSMGMSNDFEVAVEEGSTFVRLGTVLFAGLEKQT